MTTGCKLPTLAWFKKLRTGTRSRVSDWSTAVVGIAGIAACQLYVMRALQIDLRPHRRKADRRSEATSNPKVGAPMQGELPTGLRATAGGVLLWGGTVSIGASTVVVLAALSRHLHHQGFAGLATLFGLFFVASLIPSGIPLRAAALEVDGAPRMRVTGPQYAVMAAAGAAISPLIAFALHLPVLAVFFVSLQVIVAIPLAIRRGSLIAVRRFDSMGGNLFLEGGTRIVLGTVAGLLWGMNGLAGGLALATVVALIAVPRQTLQVNKMQRHMTSLAHTWLALVLLGILVQLDILIAPTDLTRSAATHYDLAALPSKGVYLVLTAVSTLIFPYVRVNASRRTVVLWTVATLAVGLAVTAVLAALRGTIGSVLGQSAASLPLLVVLGAAMSIAGATGIVINGGIALGVARPWPPLLVGIGGLLVCGFTHPTATVFGIVVLAAQAGALLATAAVCLRKQPATAPLPALT